MFDEVKRAIGPEHAVRLDESSPSTGDTAQCPGDDHRVDAAIRDVGREMFGRASQQPYSRSAALGRQRGCTFCHDQQFR
jgi:hypothetical protein